MKKPFEGINPLSTKTVLEFSIPELAPLSGERKVSRAYKTPDELIALFASDAIGAFDQPHRTERNEPAHYAGKGMIQTAFDDWFKQWVSVYMPTDHIPIDGYLDFVPEIYHSRMTVHLPATPVKMEFIARSTCEGSMEEKASAGETICGQELPLNIHLGQMLPRPYFSPTTKAPKGEKDRPVTLEEYYNIMNDRHEANYLYGMTIVIHLANRYRARAKGLDRPDQKVEFGTLSQKNPFFKHEPMSHDGWERRLSHLCRAAGFAPSAWKQLPNFNFHDFCAYSEYNCRNQIFAVIDSGGGTDDGRYRRLSDTKMGELLYQQGQNSQARMFMEQYLCKEFFRLYSKSTGQGGYSQSADKRVIVPDWVLEETGKRNLIALYTLLQ